jgi:cell division septum initiation protein DivIVA
MSTSQDQGQQVPAQRATDDVQQLEQEITETRERLGDAVEELVAKLDVKSQAKAKASRLTSTVTGRVRRVRNQAQARSSRIAGQFTTSAKHARGRAAATADQAKDSATTAAGSVPAPARKAAATGASLARKRPVQMGAAVSVLIAAIVAVLLRRKK